MNLHNLGLKDIKIGICEGENMIRIRPYKAADANTILSWCQDEIAF